MVSDLTKFGPISNINLDRAWTSIKVAHITSPPSGRTRYIQKEEEEKREKQNDSMKKDDEQKKKKSSSKHNLSSNSSSEDTPPPKKKINTKMSTLNSFLLQKEDKSRKK